MAKACGTCARGYANGEFVACGAGVDDAGLETGINNPIWATRKYSLVSIMLKASGQSSALKNDNCDTMDPSDGELCKVWEAK